MLRALLFLLVSAASAFAQIDALRAEIRALYTPVDLTNNTDLARAAIFFGRLRGKPLAPDYIKALREELDDARNTARMRSHGTAHLLFLSETPDDWDFAARMLARIDFREVPVFDFYTIASRLASRNIDISLPVSRLLESPAIRLDLNFVSKGFSFDQAALVAALLLPTSEKYWADGAIERLASERDETAQKSLLRLIWYAQSDFGDAELKNFANDPKRPISSRALARELVARTPELSPMERAEVTASSEDQLREKRRHETTGIYVKNVIPTIERDTMKILLKRRLASARN